MKTGYFIIGKRPYAPEHRTFALKDGGRAPIMGIWNWIIGSFTQGHDSGESLAESGEPAAATPATATLDPPAAAHPELETEASPRWWAPNGATLIEAVEPPKPELSAEIRAVENLLVSHFDGHDLTMPPLLHVAQSVLKHLRDPQCSQRLIANTISEDQVMAAAVLRMVNSPLYRGLHKTTTLQGAVTRLGFRAIRTLMMHQSFRAIVLDGKGEDGGLAELLWTRSLSSACVMRTLSKFSKLNEDDAFLIGLLHDIGSVIVLRILLNNRLAAQYDIDLDTFEYLCFECHQEFGELVATEWGLPSELKTLISDHHSYPADDDPLRTERIQLHLADMVNSMLGYARPVAYDLLNSRPVQDLGLADRPDFIECLERLPGEVEEAVASL